MSFPTLLGGERIHRDPVKEPFASLADNTRARELLGWKPTTKVEDWLMKYKKDLNI